jgi:glycogen operon protein
VGEGGYQVGNFPPLWSEWNGKYRDCVRDYWRGADQTLAEFASRFTGSSDLYAANGRRPYASVNFVTAHDGFTLRDLVSYNDKHNEANGEGNRDGEQHNRSWNHGVEGPSDDPAVSAVRARQQRNFLTTLLLSQGIPMLLAGDECGRTQQGNNNAFCQDNELSWFDWERVDGPLFEFTRNLIALRRSHPTFRRRGWFHGRKLRGTGADIAWYASDGLEMSDAHWHAGFLKSLTVFLNGEGIASVGADGERIVDDSFLALFNAHDETLPFSIPGAGRSLMWRRVLDTHAGIADPAAVPTLAVGDPVLVEARAIVLLTAPAPNNPASR